MENEMIIQKQEMEEPVRITEAVVEEQTTAPVVEDFALEQVETKKRKGKKKKVKKEKKSTHPLILASFIASIVFLIFHGSIVAPIVSIVLAIVGFVRAKKKGMGGIVLGIVAILLSVFTLIISSGDIVVSLLKGYYVLAVLVQSIGSIVESFDGDVFEFLGTALLVIRDCWHSLASQAKQILGFTTVYELLGGEPGLILFPNSGGSGFITQLLYKIADFLKGLM